MSIKVPAGSILSNFGDPNSQQRLSETRVVTPSDFPAIFSEGEEIATGNGIAPQADGKGSVPTSSGRFFWMYVNVGVVALLVALIGFRRMRLNHSR
jgi:hypothetical protein